MATKTLQLATKGDDMTPREARKAKGLNTDYVAEKLGIKTRTLNLKERRNTIKAFSTLQSKALCELYEVRLDDLD